MGRLQGLPLASAQNSISEFWGRHDKLTPRVARLEPILKQGIVNLETLPDGNIVPTAQLVAKLPGNTRGKRLLAKTDIQQVEPPNAHSIKIIMNRTGCVPVAAALCVAQLLHEVGTFADVNG